MKNLATLILASIEKSNMLETPTSGLRMIRLSAEDNIYIVKDNTGKVFLTYDEAEKQIPEGANQLSKLINKIIEIGKAPHITRLVVFSIKHS